MYINITKDADAYGVTQLEVPTVDNGKEFKTLISVDNGVVTGDTPATSPSTLPLSIVATTEETGKGLRRILVKVSMPYVSVSSTPCCDGGDVVTTKVAGEMTYHSVLTLPRAAVQDVMKGGVSYDAVAARAALLYNLLHSITRLGGTTVYTEADKNAGDASATKLAIKDGVLRTLNASGAAPFFGPESPFMRGASMLAPFRTSGVYGAPLTGPAHE